jgi:hypothetical protein
MIMGIWPMAGWRDKSENTDFDGQALRLVIEWTADL